MDLLDGVILLDKPAGRTSHDLVADVRRDLRARGNPAKGPGIVRVGHAGTLDPFATGLLLVLVGRATRAQRFLMALPKQYEVEALFGAVSTTGDPDGEITHTGVVPAGELELPAGRLRQRPPAWSAVQVGGRRSYALARAGEPVEHAERDIEVHEFSELGRDGARRAFRIRCSSGTYVRTLIGDLGDAYCTALRRTAIGAFDVADADPERTVPLDRALAFLPEIRLEGEPARWAAHGRPVAGEADGPVRLSDEDGLIAIAEPAGEGLLRVLVGFRG